MPRDIHIVTTPMGIINMAGEETFTPFRFTSPQAGPAMLHTSKEARDIGLKHYQALFSVEYEFRSFGFHANEIYFNSWADRVCFCGPYINGSSKEINACIQGYDIRRLAINVVDMYEGENFADGERTVDLMCEFNGWFWPGMEEILLYSS